MAVFRAAWVALQSVAELDAQLLRRTVIDMLELRGFVLTTQQRERIESCESIETLERWYAAAKTAAANHSVEQLLGRV